VLDEANESRSVWLLSLDPGGWVITGLEKLRLAWKVVRIPRERQAGKSLVA
jgi:hypothetical protein